MVFSAASYLPLALAAGVLEWLVGLILVAAPLGRKVKGYGFKMLHESLSPLTTLAVVGCALAVLVPLMPAIGVDLGAVTTAMNATVSQMNDLQACNMKMISTIGATVFLIALGIQMLESLLNPANLLTAAASAMAAAATAAQGAAALLKFPSVMYGAIVVGLLGFQTLLNMLYNGWEAFVSIGLVLVLIPFGLSRRAGKTLVTGTVSVIVFIPVFRFIQGMIAQWLNSNGNLLTGCAFTGGITLPTNGIYSYAPVYYAFMFLTSIALYLSFVGWSTAGIGASGMLSRFFGSVPGITDPMAGFNRLREISSDIKQAQKSIMSASLSITGHAKSRRGLKRFTEHQLNIASKQAAHKALSTDAYRLPAVPTAAGYWYQSKPQYLLAYPETDEQHVDRADFLLFHGVARAAEALEASRNVESLRINVIYALHKEAGKAAEIWEVYRQARLELFHSNQSRYLRKLPDMVKEFKQAKAQRQALEAQLEGALQTRGDIFDAINGDQAVQALDQSLFEEAGGTFDELLTGKAAEIAGEAARSDSANAGYYWEWKKTHDQTPESDQQEFKEYDQSELKDIHAQIERARGQFREAEATEWRYPAAAAQAKAAKAALKDARAHFYRVTEKPVPELTEKALLEYHYIREEVLKAEDMLYEAVLLEAEARKVGAPTPTKPEPDRLESDLKKAEAETTQLEKDAEEEKARAKIRDARTAELQARKEAAAAKARDKKPRFRDFASQVGPSGVKIKSKTMKRIRGTGIGVDTSDADYSSSILESIERLTQNYTKPAKAKPAPQKGEGEGEAEGEHPADGGEGTGE